VNKRWRNAGLYALLAIVVIALGTAFLTNPQSKETYSQFIQVEKGRVESQSQFGPVKALVTPLDGEKKMNLPNDPELIFSKNNVDISVLPQSDEGFGLKH